MSTTDASAPDSSAPRAPRWFVMAVPGAPLPAWEDLKRALASVVDDAATGSPHVTVGWGHGDGDPREVAARLRALSGPVADVRGAGAPYYIEDVGLHFKWAIGVNVAKTAALLHWLSATSDAFRQVGLRGLPVAERWQPHVSVVYGSPARPSLPQDVRAAALDLLAERLDSVGFTATHLHVTRLAGGAFERVAELPIAELPIGPPALPERPSVPAPDA